MSWLRVTTYEFVPRMNRSVFARAPTERMTYGGRPFKMYHQILVKRKADRKSLDNGVGVRLFRRDGKLLPSTEGMFAMKLDCSQLA
jgi:hypothetical protein